MPHEYRYDSPDPGQALAEIEVEIYGPEASGCSVQIARNGEALTEVEVLRIAIAALELSLQRSVASG